MGRRKQHLPWTSAGAASEDHHSADEVVRRTGWVFNNQTGDHLDLADFVSTGDHESLAYLEAFGLASADVADQTMVEIGSGIGRMTASFTKLFSRVIAADLDAAFLERCRETVAQFGRADHLRTSHVADGRNLQIGSDAVDLAFSYITFQHCHPDDALGLAREAVRVVRPGGHVALNFRTWTAADVLLWPAGKAVRAAFKLPVLGQALARRRVTARVGWQANRLSPLTVLDHLDGSIGEVTLVRSPKRKPFGLVGASESTFEGVHRSHWWLIATAQ